MAQSDRGEVSENSGVLGRPKEGRENLHGDDE
jgi:hypothetical protein